MAPAPMTKRIKKRSALQFVLALSLPLVACALQWLLWNKISPFVWFLFFPAVFFSAWLGGMSGGLASTVISTVLAWYFFIPPQFSFSTANPNNLFSVALFILMGIFFSFTFAMLRRANQRAEELLKATETANFRLQESNSKISALYEKTKEVETLKTQFFANISHELRTPLALIIGPVTKWLKNGECSEQTRNELEIVLRNARLLHRQVDDLLDVAKLEAGRMSMHYVQINLAHHVRLIASYFTILAEERSIDFTVNADTEIHTQIDSEKFHRIVLNLLSNAFKFTPDHGSIRVTLQQTNDYAILQVQDSGCGIPDDKHDIIFESFRQIDGTSNRQHGGTGLGLSIVKEFVALHDGNIAVENVPEGGALFSVTLPVRAVSTTNVPTEETPRTPDDISKQFIEELRATKARHPASATTQAGTVPTVLVVEDNPDMNSFICSILRPHYHVLSAFNGREGLQTAVGQLPDLILSDVMMPCMSGDTMVEEIRRCPELQQIPIIMLTAKADDDLQIKMLSRGVHDYIRKPFLPEDLLARVSVVLTERLESRKLLHLSEDRYASLAKASPIGIFQTGKDGNYQYVNDRWCGMSGISEAEALGDGWTAALHPDVRTCVSSAWNTAIQKNAAFNLEYCFLHKNGNVRWVYAQAVSMTDLSGEIVGYVGTLTDITARKQMEEDILRSKQTCERTFDAVPDLISVIDTHHTIQRVNRAMAEHCGLEPHELVGRKCYEVMHGISIPHSNCPQLKMMQNHMRHMEVVEETPVSRVFDITVSPIHDAEGNITGCVHVARDVTRRKRTEDYRSMGQDIQRILSESGDLHAAIQQIICVVKSTTGVDAAGIRLQNMDDFPYFYQEGFSLDFLHRENSLLALTQNGSICRDENGNALLECMCGLVLSGRIAPDDPNGTFGGSFWSNDTTLLMQLPQEKDPRTNPRNECIYQGFASIALIPIRAKGKIIGLLQLNDHRKGRFILAEIELLEKIAGNIGEAMLRKQAEEKLVASEQFLRTLTDNLPGMVAYWDNELRCHFANLAYLEWFGKTPEQMLGISIQELLGEELFCRNEPYMRRALQGEAQHFERTLVKPSGETGYTWAHYIPDQREGNVRGFYVLVSDITELKNAENEKLKLEKQLQQAQKMESVGRLAGGVAHDFNNKLTVILGYAEMLKMLPCAHTSRCNNKLNEIIQAGQHARELTRRLLTFSRNDTASPCQLDLNNVLTNIKKTLVRMIGEHFEIRLQLQHDVWPVSIDPTHLDQVITNLVINACDAMPHGGTITISTRNITRNTGHQDIPAGEYVELLCHDNGCGMDKHTQEHIFEPFFTTKEAGKGTGLGLSSVYGIIKQSNGDITVHSEPGKGTTFIITMPHAADCSAQIEADGVTCANLPPSNVLLVEDDYKVRKITRLLLESLGQTVIEAENPEKAIAACADQRAPIDCIITDVVMPGTNVKQLYENIRIHRPTLPVVFMSGYSADIINKTSGLADDYEFLQKPVDHRLLYKVLSKIIKPAAMLQEDTNGKYSSDR